MLRNRTLLAISFATFAAYMGSDMIIPVRVLYAQSHGASLAIIGAMTSAYLIANFAFQYPFGWLADRWGRKQVMLVGLVAEAALSLVYLLISDPVLFVVLRFAEGTVGATTLPPARALIADTTPSEKRGEAYGVFNGFFNASLLLGPGIGGLLATTGYANVFIAAALARVAATVVVLILIPSTGQRSAAKSEPARAVPLRELFVLPLIAAYILVFGDYLYIGFDLTLVPIWMHDHLGASVAVIGLMYVFFGIPTTLLSPLSGRLADRTRRSWLMLIFGIAQVPLYIAYGLINVAWPIVVLAIVHGTIYVLMQPAVDAHLAASSAADIRARVQGLYSTFGLAGAFVGASGLSMLYQVNFRLPLFTLGVAYGICVLLGGTLVRISESRGLVSGPHVREERDK